MIDTETPNRGATLLQLPLERIDAAECICRPFELGLAVVQADLLHRHRPRITCRRKAESLCQNRFFQNLARAYPSAACMRPIDEVEEAGSQQGCHWKRTTVVPISEIRLDRQARSFADLPIVRLWVGKR